jgi:hypothetical protein
MRKLVWKRLILFILIEITFRIVVDPAFTYQVNSYTKNLEGINLRDIYFPAKISHYDYLFIGDSKFATSIDVSEISNLNDSIVAINAGRGYANGVFHYWALKKTLNKNPLILKNSIVFIELKGGINYTENFEKEEFTFNENQVYLYIPHLTLSLLHNFMKYSNCKYSLKLKLLASYSCSLFRGVPFIFDNLKRLGTKYKNSKDFADAGGLKTDQESILKIRKMAIESAKIEIEQQKDQIPLTQDDMRNSTMSKMKDLIIKSGGRLVLLNLPQHSSQEAIYKTGLNLKNAGTFRIWAEKNNIPILNIDDFSYDDNDFPDCYHLSMKRKKEYTNKLIEKIRLIDITNFSQL